MGFGSKASVVSNSGATEWAWDPLISLPAVHLTKVRFCNRCCSITIRIKPTSHNRPQVHKQTTENLGNGTFTLYAVHKDAADPATLVAVVGTQHMWEITPATPVMKVGVQTYMMAAPPDAQPPARWFLSDGSRWKKETVYYSITVCEAVDDESLGLLEGILEAVAPFKESTKHINTDTPNAQEYAMAMSAQRFLDESFTGSGDAGPIKRKAGASAEAEAWLPVPQEEGYSLKKPKHSVLGLSDMVAEQPEGDGGEAAAPSEGDKLQRQYTSKVCGGWGETYTVYIVW